MKRYSRGKNPNSLKNLQSFGRGVSGNKEGSRRHNHELKTVRRLSVRELEQLGALLLNGTVKDLKRLSRDKTAPVFQVWFAKIICKSMKTGDSRTWVAVLNRLLGPPREQCPTWTRPQTFVEFVAAAHQQKVKGLR